MMTLFLDRGSDRPLYEQLCREFRKRIEEGTLKAGEKLPSKRALAAELGISPITVENAYAQLVAEGYLEARPKSGFFVEARLGPLPGPLRPIPQPESERTPWSFDFRTNVADPDLFPYAEWAKLGKEILLSRGPSLLNRTDPQGMPELRQAIAGILDRHRGIHADPSQIVVGSGTESLLALLLRLLDFSGTVAVENPGYEKVRRTYKGFGAKVVPVGLDAGGLRLDGLEASGARLVHVTPSHQFPTGTVMPVGRRLELLRWAAAGSGRRIVEDDYDSEFRYSGLPIPALQGLDPAGKVLYLNSFSKTLGPGLRIGYLVLPPDLSVRFRDSSPAFACAVPAFDQAVLAGFLSGGGFDRHLLRGKKAGRDKRDRLLSLFASGPLGPLTRVINADSGLHFLLEVRNGMNEEALVAAARERGVRVYGLSEFSAFPDPGLFASTVVLGYPGIPSSGLGEAVRRMEEAWCFPTFPKPARGGIMERCSEGRDADEDGR